MNQTSTKELTISGEADSTLTSTNGWTWVANFIVICWLGIWTNNPANGCKISGYAVLLLSVLSYLKRHATYNEPLKPDEPSDGLVLCGLVAMYVFVAEGVSTNWFSQGADSSSMYVYVLPAAFVSLFCCFFSVKPKTGLVSLCALAIVLGLGRFVTQLIGNLTLAAMLSPLVMSFCDSWSRKSEYRYSGHLLLWAALVLFLIEPTCDHASSQKNGKVTSSNAESQTPSVQETSTPVPEPKTSSEDSQISQLTEQPQDNQNPSLQIEDHQFLPHSNGLAIPNVVPDAPEIVVPNTSLSSTKQDTPTEQGSAAANGYFSLGSTKQDVLNVQGTPTGYHGDTWNYGFSSVVFRNGVVSEFSNISHNLKVALSRNENSVAAASGYFSVGSSEQDVLDVQGTPTGYHGDTWNYGFSNVAFRNGVVSEFSNISHNLKVAFNRNGNSAAAASGYFSIGSSEQDVLDVQGIPTGYHGDTWNYGFSSVVFRNGVVSEFSNISHNLKVALSRNENSAAAASGYFSIGSSKQDVLDVQGTPTGYHDDTWNYDFSSVTFKNEMVDGYSSISHNLRVSARPVQ